MRNPVIAPVNIPSLETERLVLRGHRLEDFSASAAMWADENVTRHILDQPLTEEVTWSRFLRYIGHWAALGFGYWLMEEKHTGRFVGEAGFADYKRGIDAGLKGVPEIGWVLASEAHGKGYATEAVRKLTAWADAHFQTQTYCIIAPENKASVHVAAKCGYHELPPSTYHGKPVFLFVREKASRQA
jgi:RimJ/RimL family protein N-acetyltransferase